MRFYCIAQQLILILAMLLGACNAHAELQLFFVHNDHLNTPKYMTDESGATVWQAKATPFGEVVENEDFDGDGKFVTLNMRFPGQYWDHETGTSYNMNRDYDPRSGRYIQSDPIGLGGGINTYAYVSSNPTSFMDFFGLDQTCKCKVTFSAVGPNQATGIGALGILPPKNSVAISPASFGLPYKTIPERVATQKSIKNNMAKIQISAPSLGTAYPGGTDFSIGDVGDQNIRNSPSTRFDIYRFDTQKSALEFGKKTNIDVTITGVPDDWTCPK